MAEKTNDPSMDESTGAWANLLLDRWINGWMDRWIDKLTDGQLVQWLD